MPYKITSRFEMLEGTAKPKTKMSPSKTTGLQSTDSSPQCSRASNMSASPSSPLVAQGVAASERSRSALRICFEILEMVRDKGPSESTNIKRMANLSHVGFTKYLEKLVSQGLLREDEDQSRNGKSYTLTAKGLDFVNQVREMEAFLAGFGLSL